MVARAPGRVSGGVASVLTVPVSVVAHNACATCCGCERPATSRIVGLGSRASWHKGRVSRLGPQLALAWTDPKSARAEQLPRL